MGLDGSPAVWPISTLTPAGDVENRASYEGSFVRQQPQNGCGDFFGLASALHGDLGFYPVHTTGFPTFGVHLGVK